MMDNSTGVVRIRRWIHWLLRPLIGVVAAALYMASTACAQTTPAAPSATTCTAAIQAVASGKVQGFPWIAAQLLTGADTARVLPVLDSLLNDPKGDMFWYYPAAGFYMTCRGMLNQGRRAQFLHALKTYTPYRGDTENHFLMYYMAMLLFAQEFPDLTAADYMNGRSSKENYDQALDYLKWWTADMTDNGLTEWDSPRYTYYYMAPLLLLGQHARDTVLRARCRMLTEWVLADFALAYLNGSYCGPHSRDGDALVINPRDAESGAYARFYFHDTVTTALPDLVFAAASDFRCPGIVRDMALNRAEDYVQTGVRRCRAKIRFSKTRYTLVPRYLFMTRDYALGSMAGGLHQPFQQHSWDVTFGAPRANNTLFIMHPYTSYREAATFFPEEPELLVANVLSAKAGYGNPDKWLGGSPYEHLYQYNNTLIALYDLPADEPAKYLNGFLPATLDTAFTDSTGWILCRMEDVYVGLRLLACKAQWISEKVCTRLRITPADTGANAPVRLGYIVECAPARSLTFDQFRTGLAGVQITITGQPAALSLRYRGLQKLTLQATTAPGGANQLRVNGWPQRPNAGALNSGPRIQCKRGSGILQMSCMGRKRTLNFRTNTVTDQ